MNKSIKISNYSWIDYKINLRLDKKFHNGSLELVAIELDNIVLWKIVPFPDSSWEEAVFVTDFQLILACNWTKAIDIVFRISL